MTTHRQYTECWAEVTRLYCPACKAERWFRYYGPQARRGVRVFDLYTCAECGDTVSHNQSEEWKAEHRVNREPIKPIS